MNIQIDRKNLLNALCAVKPGLAVKEIVEQSSSVVFSEGYIHTYNDEVYLCYPYQTEFEGAIIGQELFALLNKASENTLKLIIDEQKLKIKIKGKNFTANLPYEKKVTLPYEEIPKPDKWFDLPDSFCDDIELCLFSISRELMKPLLTCIHCNQNTIESSDDFRITRKTLSNIFFPEELLLPGKSMKALINIQPTKYCKVAGWIWFMNNKNILYSCRIFNTNKAYPDFTPILKVEGGQLVFPDNVLDIIDKAKIFSLDPVSEKHMINVQIKDSTLTISSESHRGTFSEEIRARHRGDNANFRINPEFLKTVLNKISYQCKIDNTRAKFEGNNYEHVIRIMSEKFDQQVNKDSNNNEDTDYGIPF